MLVRNLRPGEGPAAAALANCCPGAAHWPAGDYERLAAGSSARQFCLVVEEPRGEMAGLLVASVVVGEAEILNLAVTPEKRGQGLANALLAELLARLMALGAQKIWLEVRESNQRAVAFYRRHGFETAGRRLDYYQAPREDALVLARSLRQGSAPG